MNSPEPSVDRSSTALDLRQYLDVLLKWKWVVLGLTALMLTAAALWTFSRTKIYRANAAVLVSRFTPEVLGGKVREVVDLTRESYWDSEQYLQNQLVVACSASVARRAAQQLNLHNDRRFWSMLAPERRNAQYSLDDAAGMLRGSTFCSARRKTTIIDISVTHTDGAMAGKLANAMAQAYIEQNLEYKLSSSAGATEWLAKQLDGLQQQIQDSEKSLYDFKRNNNLLAMPLSGQQNLLTRQTERLSDELGNVRLKRMALDSQLEQLKSIRTDDPLAIPAGPLLDTSVMDQLKTTYIEQRRQYLAIKARYLEQHPQVIEQRAQMVAAADDVRREVRNRIAGLSALRAQALKQEQQLAAALQQVKKDALDLSRTEQAYLQLKRPLNTTSQLYDMLLARMKESDLSGQLRVNNMQLLEPAGTPRGPISPQARLNLLVGLLLGLLLGVGLAFLLEAFDNSVKSSDDVTQLTGMVCLGAVPGLKHYLKEGGQPHPMLARAPALIPHYRPLSIPAEAWRAIRTNLLFSSPDRPVKTLVVTSPSPKEGKTTMAVGMATAMAQAGKRVLLIDADMRQPRLHEVFAIGKGEGLTAALRDAVAPGDVIRTTEVPNLFVLPCGALPPNPAELCQSERLYKIVQSLAEEFDRIFIDAPPALWVTDPVLLAARFDATVLVARTGKTQRRALRDCYRQIREVGGHVAGCVLNDMDLSHGSYRYYPYRARAYSAAAGAYPGQENA